MITRRTFLGSAAATAGLAATTATAQTYLVPDQQLPRVVQINRDYAPGELHVEPDAFKLYWMLGPGLALEYAVGIGRAGLYESGDFRIKAKKEWPSWTPTPDMIARDPGSYKRYEDGMEGGINNPLGARALYLFRGNRDTFLRIHGTNAPRTIGTAVSNGCVRLLNSHITDLYTRVPMNSRAVLH
ncbi:L,D-transpeptidase [Thalassorhabdomicrobium marinisediminis]|uniref:L,D-transpeptidase n=1 Tax=Thalassorhabdomicrobium marinisediminis TaxID=2170577 RepID=UPI002492D90D|nr:L,D-transpeptidase [Thalassorhabdomicrobium marinisediminis]